MRLRELWERLTGGRKGESAERGFRERDGAGAAGAWTTTDAARDRRDDDRPDLDAGDAGDSGSSSDGGGGGE